MSYANNLTDPSKKSVYLVKLQLVANAPLSAWIDLPAQNPYIDWPYGQPISRGGFFSSSQAYFTSISKTFDSNDPDKELQNLINNFPFDETYDPILKRITANSGTIQHNSYAIELYFSTESTKTYSSPDDSSTDVVDWKPLLTEEPEVVRDSSSLVNGFTPVQVSNVKISKDDDQVATLAYDSFLKTAYFNLYHVVGDPSDETNAKLIFEGRVDDYTEEIETLNLTVTDRFITLNQQLTHPSGDNDYSSFIPLNGPYNVSNPEQSNPLRKIYGYADFIKATNIDRPNQSLSEVPTVSNNRIWNFAIYDGDNTRLEDIFVDADSTNNGIFISAIPDDSIAGIQDALSIVVTYDQSTATDQEILDAYNKYFFLPNDWIKVQFDVYPGETFYFQIRLVRKEFLDNFMLTGLSVAPNSNLSLDYNSTELFGKVGAHYALFIDGLIDQVSNQTGDTVNDVKKKLYDDISDPGVGGLKGSVERSVCPILYLLDNDGVNHRLDFDVHYTTFKDLTKKVYGIQLIDNAESLIAGLSYTPLTGDEVVFGRVYGQKALDNTYSKPIQRNISNDGGLFSIPGENWSFNFFYSFFKDYIKLEDSQIDLDAFEFYTTNFAPRVNSDGATKIFEYKNLNPSIRSFNSWSTILPATVGGSLPTVIDQLNKMMQLHFCFVYINNDNKWSVKFIANDFMNTPKAEFTDRDFEFLSSIHETVDMYNLTQVNDSFAEQGLDERTTGKNSTFYYKAALAYSNQELSQDVFFPNVTIDNFVERSQSTILAQNTTGTWAEPTIALYKYPINIVEITVGRQFFDLDIGDVITVDSEYLMKRFNQNDPKRYTIVGIRQTLDFRILKLTDAANRFVNVNDINIWENSAFVQADTFVST